MADEATAATEIELSKDAAKIMDLVEKLPVLELANLVKALEEKFGVSAAAPAMMMAAPGGAADGGAEEQSSFDVEITSAGDSKINVIKVVREITGQGLKEAKGIVDAAPAVVKEGASKEEAEELKAKLEEAGAVVTLK